MHTVWRRKKKRTKTMKREFIKTCHWFISEEKWAKWCFFQLLKSLLFCSWENENKKKISSLVLSDCLSSIDSQFMKEKCSRWNLESACAVFFFSQPTKLSTKQEINFLVNFNYRKRVNNNLKLLHDSLFYCLQLEIWLLYSYFFHYFLLLKWNALLGLSFDDSLLWLSLCRL